MYTSRVIKGKGRGKQIGFPTFNLAIPNDIDEKYGVYSAEVIINGKTYSGALHYGPIPTFDQKVPVLEVFVIDYTDDKLVHEISYQFIKLLREIRTFSSPYELKKQIAEDVKKIKAILS